MAYTGKRKERSTYVKDLGAQVKEFKTASILTPIFMILEVIMETVIPLLMSSIIDDGVEAGNMQHIYQVGALMVVAAAIGLFSGMMGGKFAPGRPRICAKSPGGNVYQYSELFFLEY